MKNSTHVGVDTSDSSDHSAVVCWDDGKMVYSAVVKTEEDIQPKAQVDPKSKPEAKPEPELKGSPEEKS